jgi:hypothetical protein
VKDAPQQRGVAGGMSRRGALGRLELAATAAYVAPTILHFDRTAKAVTPSCSSGGKGHSR